ncbi:hypothetical protein A2U01_0097308, partial [Trifolium medium]|nr:hypothetical protein [Trifolium medium]
VAVADHSVEIHPPVPLSCLLHIWYKGNRREVDASLLHYSFCLYELAMFCLSCVDEMMRSG